MRNGIVIKVTRSDRRRLQALINGRNTPQKHVWRADIVVLTADGAGTNAIMRRTGKSKTCVWRWQERFAVEGVDGLVRDKTRPSRIKPLGEEVAARVVELTFTDPPGEATHWTAVMMAKVAGISVSSVQRIWRAHGLQPHRVRQFKLSNDADFAGELRSCPWRTHCGPLYVEHRTGCCRMCGLTLLCAGLPSQSKRCCPLTR
jgi:transposase